MEVTIIGLGLDTTQLASGAVRGVAALQQVEAAARQAQQVLGTLGQSTLQQATSTGQLTTAQQAQATQTHTLTAAVQSLTTGMVSLTATQHQTVSALNQLTAAQHAQTAAQQAAIVAKQQAAAAQAAHRAQLQASAAASQQWQTVLHGARLALGALGVQLGLSGLVAFGKDIITTGLRMEQLRANIVAISGGLQQGTAGFQFLTGVAQRLALPVEDLSRNFIGLTAATRGTVLEGEPTKRIFESIAMAARGMGVSNAEAHRGFLAIEQMLSRGTITMEEFRKQMGQALPGSMQVAARAMGMPLDALEAFIATGQQKAIPFVVRLSEQFRTEFAGGIERATGTAQAEITKFGNQWTLFKEQISKGPIEAVIRVTRIGMEALTGTVEQAAAVRARTAERLGKAGDVATSDELEQADEASKRTLLPQGPGWISGTIGEKWRAEKRAEGDAELLAMRGRLQARQIREQEDADAREHYAAPSREANIAQLEQAGRVQALDRALAVIPPLMRRINAEAELTPLTFQRSAEMARELSKALDKAREAAAAFPGGAGLPPAARAQLLEYDRELKRAQEQKTTEASLAKVVPLSERLATMRLRMADDPEQSHQILKQTISELERDQRRIAGVQTRAGGGAGAYGELIEQSAARYGMDPDLIRAIIQIESRFNPAAVSPKGAQGLMQLMPGTGRELRVTDAFDPAENIDAGTRYFAQQLRATGGNIPQALTRYNAGPATTSQPGTYARDVQAAYAQMQSGGAVSSGDGAAQVTALTTALAGLRSEEKALADARKEAAKTSTPEQARGAVEDARKTAAEQAEKDFEALTKLRAPYYETAAARDVDTASKLRARLASSELYGEKAREFALDIEKMAALKDTLPLLREQAAASAAVLAADQRARGSLERYEEQFGLTPEGATITPETRALVRFRETVAPLRGTELEGRAKAVESRLELDADRTTRAAKKFSDTVVDTFVSMASGSKPSLEQIRNTFVKTLMDIIFDATNAKAEMTKLLTTGMKAGIDWLGLAPKLIPAAPGTPSSLDGASAGTSGLGSIPGLQHGGPAYANSPYLVGERGPELFVPQVSGTVLPNRAGARHTGMAPVSYTINMPIQTPDVASFRATEGQMSRQALRRLMRMQRYS